MRSAIQEKAPVRPVVLPETATTGEEPAGLTTAAAERRRAAAGVRGITGHRRVAAATQLAHLFTSPLVLLLLIAAGVSGVLGDRTGAAIIVGIVLVSAALDFTQTFHSQRAADSLRRQVAPTATVKRDGQWGEVPQAAVVPGDLIRLRAGDLVPADGVVVASDGLHVQQAALTGESLPVEKTACVQWTGEVGGDADDPHRVFLGTSVTSGSALAEVTTTGDATAFGQIAQRLSSRPPETEFERGMRELSLLVTRAVFFLVLFVVLVSAARHRPPLESLLFAVALAVGMTPEFLPMITAVTLGRGAMRMAKRKVIVKHLQAIENLGAMDVLCSDKTGTLTADEMRLDAALDPQGNPSARVLSLARLNSGFATGVQNAMDTAILAAPPLPDEVVHPDDARRIQEIPFDFERRRLSVVAALGDKTLLITKGAPENILAVCTDVGPTGIGPSGGSVAEGPWRERCAETFRRLSEQGYRVLAVAVKEVAAGVGPWRPEDEAGMTLVGYLTFVNPPLPDAAAMLERLRRDGVTVKILTGDNELVTGQLCSSVGLPAGRIVLGTEMDRLDDAALAHVAEAASVFARVSPAQKNRVILALKRRGHVVGFLGDGINDAPSLHAADVGISVATAVDVAKDAAEIILLERSLAVLHDGILEGRRAFGNVLKYLLMNLSSNFGNMLSMAGASLFLPFLPMLPTQILLNNFLYDLSQVTIPTDNVDAEVLRRPHRWDMRLIRDFMAVAGPLSSLYDFLTFWALVALFHAGPKEFHTGWFVESLATQTLVIFVIRTAGRPWRSRPSAALAVTVVGAAVAGMVIPFTPAGRAIGFVPLPMPLIGLVILVTVTYLALLEVLKRHLLRRL